MLENASISLGTHVLLEIHAINLLLVPYQNFIQLLLCVLPKVKDETGALVPAPTVAVGVVVALLAPVVG